MDEHPPLNRLHIGSDDSEDLLQPIAKLIDQLRSEQTSLRIESMKKLSTIGLALGPERIINELIPFLEDSLDDEDEVLEALAVELGKMTEYLDGKTECLVPLLEALAAADEPVVRQAALSSFKTVIEKMDKDKVQKVVVPVVLRLGCGEWFASKTSACALVPLTPHTTHILASLATDDSPTVRKAVCTNLASLIEQSKIDFKEAVETVKILSADPQDSVRLWVSFPLAALFEQSTEKSIYSSLVSMLLALAGDPSWRIRYTVAQNFDRFAKSVSSSPELNPIKLYCTLLRDSEAEVRTAAAKNLAKVGTCASQKEELLAIVSEVAHDPSPHVKAALALCLNEFTASVGPELTVQHIMPLVLQLLQDESSEVRLNVIAHMETTVKVIGIEQLYQTLLPAISKLSMDRQWRVRQTVIEHLPNLARLLGKEQFSETLLDMNLSWLDDPVAEVRRCAGSCLAEIISGFGFDWAADHQLLQRLSEFADNPNYLRRQSLINCLSHVCKNSGYSGLLFPIMDKLSRDPIPNVRLSLARLLTSIDSPDTNPLLSSLLSDEDPDVRFYANK